ncbi:MAG: metalloprotease [Nanoarchaeota archaeon]
MVEYVNFTQEKGPRMFKFGKFSFSTIELRHLGFALFMITLTLMVLNRASLNVLGIANFITIYLITIGSGFLFHEIAHKLVAQHYGFVSEFRADFFMMFFALILAFSGFTFLAPGAVLILTNRISIRQNGIISVAGPLTNLVLAILFLGLSFFSVSVGSEFWTILSVIGVQVNAFLGIFNMLPFWVLDGKKVLRWSKPVYFGVLLPLIGMFVLVLF